MEKFRNIECLMDSAIEKLYSNSPNSVFILFNYFLQIFDFSEIIIRNKLKRFKTNFQRISSPRRGEIFVEKRFEDSFDFGEVAYH